MVFERMAAKLIPCLQREQQITSSCIFDWIDIHVQNIGGHETRDTHNFNKYDCYIWNRTPQVSLY